MWSGTGVCLPFLTDPPLGVRVFDERFDDHGPRLSRLISCKRLVLAEIPNICLQNETIQWNLSSDPLRECLLFFPGGPTCRNCCFLSQMPASSLLRFRAAQQSQASWAHWATLGW